MKEKKQGEASQAGLRPHTQAALKQGPGASPALTPEGQGDACSVPESPRPPAPLPFISAPTVWRVIRSHSYSSYECKIITTANYNILAFFFFSVLWIHKFPQIFNRDDPLKHASLHSLRKCDQLLFNSHWCVSRAPLGVV